MTTNPVDRHNPFLNDSLRLLIAPALLFICLIAWSLSAPINNGLDPTFHLANIWCGWGESPGICEEVREINSGYVAKIPNYLHGVDSPTLSDQEIAQPDARSLFYSIMRVFVSKNATASVLSMRFFQSLLVSFIFWALIKFSIGKIRVAIVSAWTFTITPIIVSTLSQTTPRSWAYISGLSSWAFLLIALDRLKNHQKSKIVWVFFGLSILIAVASRWDATLFASFSSSLILLIYLLKEKKIEFKQFGLLALCGALLLIIARIIFPRLASYTTFDFGSTFTSGRTVFQLIHIPENIADGFGLGVRLVDLGPNLIGIIGTVLFAFVLSRSLINYNRLQIGSVISISIFVFLVMFRMTISWPEQTGPSGVYVVQLLSTMLGISIALSGEKQDYLLRISNRTIFISLLGLSHALTLFSRMEWAVRPSNELNDTYFNLSLNGGWWWNSPIGPNVVYLLGAFAFPAWLIVSWNIVAKTSTEISS